MTTGVRLSAAIVAAAVALGAAVALRASAPACPTRPVPALSATPPDDVCIPDGFVDVPMEYFDDFAWKTFVSLVWPAKERGIPAKDKPVSAPGPKVFETFKSLWEVFHPDGSAPAGFSVYDTAANNACNVTPQFGDLVFASFSGVDDLGQAGNGALDPPVVAQNGRYVRTLTFYNQRAFEVIANNKFYLRDHLPPVSSPRPDVPVLEFPDGSIVLKSSWIDVDGLAPELVKRFYTRSAIVRRPGGTDCSRVTMGLVGLHVVEKTPSRPQWIWATFEQTDTVPFARPDAPGLFVFNDGQRTPMPAMNPLKLVPLPPEPVAPFNITRNSQILTQTDLATFRYQDLLAGTPWRYYRLVMSQWPRLDGNQATPVPKEQDGSVPHTFPGVADFSSSANVTMETFDQHGVQLGCMNCHNRVRLATDFLWTLQNHAYPQKLAPAVHEQ